MLKKTFIPLAGIFCLLPQVPSAFALILGVTLALTLGNIYLPHTKNMTHRLLTTSVMGLGAGMNLEVVSRVGIHGIGYTLTGILGTFGVGRLLGKLLRTESKISTLIVAGTAICGGSAIAAVAPTIRAKSHEVSVALGTVFFLNALALLLFPWIGHSLHLTEAQFGLWSALAIHDTSSVVGATLTYGPHSLEVGTTVKLARALWIVPMTLVIGFFDSKDQMNVSSEKPKRPWFILGFLLAAALVTWIPDLRPLGGWIEFLAKRCLVLTLFLIGANLNRETLQSVGVKPFLQGSLLWTIVGSLSLIAILQGWVG